MSRLLKRALEDMREDAASFGFTEDSYSTFAQIER
jgi:hypothetical protein